MLIRNWPKNKINIINVLFIFMFGVVFICSCQEDEEDPGIPALNLTTNSGWDRTQIKQIESRGIVSPHVKVIKDRNDILHIAYFEGDVPEEDTGSTDIYEDNRYFYIKYRTFDIPTMENSEETLVIEGLDNCMGLDLALDQNLTPAVAYQGGLEKECGIPIQADAMFSIIGNSGEWEEYTGASGDVDRNPYFVDGYAGANLSVAFDSMGNLHMGYQFKWEGCDAMNLQYPDLRYIGKSPSQLNTDVTEEAVEGNIYVNNGTGYQNYAGSHNDILIDGNDEPAVFYYAHLPPSDDNIEYVQGLRVARRQGGAWQYQWIETGIEVGDISCSLDNNQNPAVAYYVTSFPDDENAYNSCLKYARLDGGTWNIEVIDEATLCGNYCSLAFDSTGNPAVAYYSLMSRTGRSLGDLRLARFNGQLWTNAEVEDRGDIGYYNSLFFDQNDRVFISTYSYTDKMIYLYFQ